MQYSDAELAAIMQVASGHHTLGRKRGSGAIDSSVIANYLFARGRLILLKLIQELAEEPRVEALRLFRGDCGGGRASRRRGGGRASCW